MNHQDRKDDTFERYLQYQQDRWLDERAHIPEDIALGKNVEEENKKNSFKIFSKLKSQESREQQTDADAQLNYKTILLDMI